MRLCATHVRTLNAHRFRTACMRYGDDAVVTQSHSFSSLLILFHSFFYTHTHDTHTVQGHEISTQSIFHANHQFLFVSLFSFVILFVDTLVRVCALCVCCNNRKNVQNFVKYIWIWLFMARRRRRKNARRYDLHLSPISHLYSVLYG